MKHNGEIQRLLQTKCRNEREYYDLVLNPLFDHLGIPRITETGAKPRWPEFPIKTYLGDQETDYLILVDDIPVVACEAKPRTNQFEGAKKQVQFFATNFDPKRPGVRKQTVPFVLVATGKIAKMYKVTVGPDGLTPVFEELDGLLEWHELVEIAETYKKIGARIPYREIEAIPLLPEQSFEADQMRQIFEEISQALRGSRSIRDDDTRIRCHNEILLQALKKKAFDPIFERYKLAKWRRTRIEEVLSWYELDRVAGPTMAYAYRQFVAYNFIGEAFGYRNVGRYLTPIEVIRFMVRLVDVKPSDRVIDFASGSGGFLGEIAGRVRERFPDRAEDFIKNNLIGMDIDPFSVSTTKTFLSLLYPRMSGEFKVFQHNGLYSEDIGNPEILEDRGVARYVQEGTFDVVISNPPGNDSYSGTNASYVRQKYGQYTYFQDVFLFMRRAIELAKPDGGRICLIVPNGFLSNARAFQSLRDEIMRHCQIKLIVSLPRLFKGNNASMAVVYIVRSSEPDKEQEALLASIPLEYKYTDEETGETIYERVNIEAEFDHILEGFKH